MPIRQAVRHKRLLMDFKAEFPNYDVDENGTVYKNGNPIKPFKSNKYLQVLLFI